MAHDKLEDRNVGGNTRYVAVTDAATTVAVTDAATSSESTSTTTPENTNSYSNMSQLKEAAELITTHRNQLKTEMDDLSKNIYSAINQLNFSIKLITDTNNFLSRYVNTEDSLLDKLTIALTTVTTDDVNIDLYNNMTFNNTFISNIMLFENFAKILMEAVSYHLSMTSESSTREWTVKAIHENYCKAVTIKNNWDYFQRSFDSFYQNYKNMFGIKAKEILKASELTELLALYNAHIAVLLAIPGTHEEAEAEIYALSRHNEIDSATSELAALTIILSASGITPFILNASQLKLLNQYTDYVDIFEDLHTLFKDNTTTYEYKEVSEFIAPSIQQIINFKTGSTLYDNYLTRLGSAMNDTSNLFARLITYAKTLVDHNKEYQPNFETDNQYIYTIIQVCTISNSLLAALSLKYPNKNSRQGLILDSDFTRVLTTITNLFNKEINTSVQLLDSISKDYKLIKSLETFMTTEPSFDNQTVFRIMNNFDQEMSASNITETLTLGSLIRPYFAKTNSSSDVFGTNSFTYLLADASILTEPFYDLLNYYRLFLFGFLSTSTTGASLVFDFLETLYINNLSITNQSFNTAMHDLFEIKLANIDYININKSKINDSITSRYSGLDYLNYFDIQPYINIIKSTNLSSITTISQLTTLFSSLPAYDLIIFSIVENILYNNIDLSLVMNNLSIKSNIRTLFFKLMFLIAINHTITTINTYCSTQTPAILPTTLPIYNILTQNLSDFTQDLNYLKLLISASDYYNGIGTIFNISKITNFYSATPADYIWDPDKLTKIIKLFSIYKEV